MKAAIVPQHGRLEVADISPPEPGPYDCLVRIDACAICTGTDLNLIAGNFPSLEKTPFVLGHESTGLIVEVGGQVRNFQVGQRVTRPAAVLAGQRRDDVGSMWGGFAELGLVRDDAASCADGVESNVSSASRSPMPDDVDVVSAALSVNQREILSATAKLGLDEASRVVVVGSGYNGLLYCFFSKHFGAGRVAVVGNAARAELAAAAFDADGFVNYRDKSAADKVHALLDGEPTHVIDAVGTVRSATLARELLGPKTAFGRYGMHEWTAASPLADEIHRSHPKLELATDEAGCVGAWHELWRKGAFDREGMCDGVVPLDGIVEALGRLARREALKLVVTM
jgi:threonine dehydrogenase-like Zn-dependent dehydrogenase